MKKDNEILKSLIANGTIGANLSALISKKRGVGGSLATIAREAILATFKANEKAKQTHVPFLVKESNALYEIQADGTKQFVKNIEKPIIQLPNHFKLK
ncbi:MAG: hypothetical protein QM528_05855 [Phycisphaerales bacterium]|nr:hypothetical protein [Phycisphaerales bacterium]